ncbi:MAG: zinc-ribbon domain-containing protein [Deltaproteobacteria bacterium]|nr:zinc-ribbon domain-containing protein [Deltaproteobacteria bacterium]
MIITCNECSTSFNLDDSLVKEKGSKVRCSICKHIFTAFPLPQEPEKESEESSDLNFESFPDDDFSFDEIDLEIDEDDESQEIELEESHWEFEGDDGIEFEDSEEEDSEEEEFDSIEFEDFEEEEFDDIKSDSIEDEPASLDSTESESILKMEDETAFQAPDYQTLEEESLADKDDDDEFELEFDIEAGSENGEPDIPDDERDEDLLEIETEPEDDFSEYDEILEPETEPEKTSFEKEIIEEKVLAEELETLMDTAPKPRKRKKKSLVGTPVLVLLLIFFLVIGAYIASGMTGYKIPYLSDIKIPFIEQYFKKSVPEKLDVKPVPNQKSVNGRFVTNSTAGPLFVITGRVENLSNIVYSHIEIRGTLITKGKVEAKIKNIFCGNIITEEMLKTGNISDINKLLALKKGNHHSNVNIKPGASVPFMVVFSDLPEKLQNFTVKVIKFEKNN